MKKKLLLLTAVGVAVGVGIYFGKKYLGNVNKEIEDKDVDDIDDWDDLSDDDFEDECEPKSNAQAQTVESVIPTPENIQNAQNSEVKPERPWSAVNSDGSPASETPHTV